MNRAVDTPAPPWRAIPSPEPWELHLTTLTPMFGGGAVPREVGDPPVRAAAIRGHLRFWWRATAGSNAVNAEDLYGRETAIWGDTKTPGRVRLSVDVPADGRGTDWRPSSVPAPTFARGPQEGYFVFPFQAVKKENKPEAVGRLGVSFNLHISVGGLDADQMDEVRSAVRAWITFGGVGSRTRRGLGALVETRSPGEWRAPSPSTKDFGAWLESIVSSAAPGADAASQLHGAVVILGPPVPANGAMSEAMEVWRLLGRFWAQYRKGHYFERNAPQWPGQRTKIGCEWEDYRTLTASQNRPILSIELAKPFLGLPIIYQRFPTAPYAPSIVPEHSGRWASPIIVKPAVFADGACRPLVVVLNHRAPQRVRIGDDKAQRVVDLRWPQGDNVVRKLQATGLTEAIVAAARATWGEGSPVLRIGGSK